ncbi:MAG TPA: DNA gyrase inhibitor YacG [Casimicrobiaceae bacterium]|nr:DNA gyrase inhibitor YacG [Casimicrobiaceae bacterium]
MKPSPRVVSCPHCGKPVEWTAESKWRPFCSERCKTIDLGAWATERYRIAAGEATEESELPDEDPSAPER